MRKRCVDESRKEVQIPAIIYARREQAKRLEQLEQLSIVSAI
ncbi:hypothetical protein HMPREF1581_00951 [Gardnerella vaginalis JCP8108]|uniref:Uncharacterized protein n=1 Tax=Gardnerella vaginalis JCP8108 TaxID=1261066 RepID=S4I066_GARVA|nr:hypothetical protein HMPREF1581_00951 [Gardnerella vaginalis JCP8108]